jgi:ribonuclease HI
MNKITIRFDGGSKPTNPGNKYGSFEVALNGRQVALMSRLQLGWGTNNEAEFEIFEAALKWTVANIKQAGNEPSTFVLEAFSDSTIVVKRLNKEVRSRKKEPALRMAKCAVKCFNYTREFQDFKIHWNGRIENVNRFGH